jgi:hypothetical protein
VSLRNEILAKRRFNVGIPKANVGEIKEVAGDWKRKISILQRKAEGLKGEKKAAQVD